MFVCQSPLEFLKAHSLSVLSNLLIEENVVWEKLTKLNVNKSQGPDELHGKLLYEVRDEIT